MRHSHRPFLAGFFAPAVRPAFGVEAVIGTVGAAAVLPEGGERIPEHGREGDHRKVERPEDGRLNGVAVFMHEEGAVAHGMAVNEDECPEGGAAPVIPRRDDRPVKPEMPFPAVQQKQNQPRQILRRTPGRL